MKLLSRKQQAFIDALAEGTTASQAYCRAYDVTTTNRKSISRCAHRLVASAKLAPLVEAARRQYAERMAESTSRVVVAQAVRHESLLNELNLSRERVLRGLAQIAFADLTQIASWDSDGKVTFRASDQIGEAPMAALAEISVATRSGQGAVRLKLHDKLAALTTLARIMGLFSPERSEDAPQTLTITLSPPEGGRAA